MNRRGQKLLTQLGALLLVLLLVPVLALVGFAEETDTAAEPVCYEHGDVNGDTVVDSRDAVYTLYHAVWSDTDAEKYPVSQDCDFNADGAVDGKDAIWLLYASLGIVDGYELEGTVHAYYAPEWSWAEDYTATLNLRCGCGSGSKTVVAQVVNEHQDAACTTAGWDTYKATAEFGGETYESTKTVAIAATGHVLGERTCTEGTACSNEGCTYTLPALGHSYQVDGDKSTAATCTTDAVNVYVCQTCGDEKTVTEHGSATGHTYGEGEVTVNGCVSDTSYKCQNCDHTIVTDPVTSHLYTVTLTAEPNCTNPGTRTYTCRNCGDSYTEEVAANGVHVWDAGVTAEGLTTYTCTCCGTTKTAVVASTTAEVSKETLQEAEVQLENASIALDEATLEGIQGEDAIIIEVVEKDAAELGLNTSELPGEIVEGKVYDFTMKQGETEITEFDGSVTISIPYTLQDGDDVDCIDVWFITDDGNVDCYKGTYSNGQVTFTTTHFSYYTVTRLTAAERCAQYGHVEKTAHLDPACDTDGYDMVSCQRCGNVEKTVLSATGHDYTETRQEASCTADGSVTKVCGTCGYENTTLLPALGHAWGEPVVEAATCTAAGCETYTCAACGESYTATLEQLAHSYEVTEEVSADCTTDGYTAYKCVSCGDTYTESTGSATGHDYQAAEENWAWSEDHSQATVTLVCAHNAEHTKTLNAAVSKTSEDCYGHVVYTATASFNNVAYTSVKEVDTGVESHTPGEEWSSFGLYHYHYCIRCGMELDRAEHNLTEQTVVTEPTCVTSGSAVATCTVCDTRVTFTLPATGTHSYVSGVCVVCGTENAECDHQRKTKKELDLSEYGVCEGKFWILGCECGEEGYFTWEEMTCNTQHVGTRQEIRPNGKVVDINTYKCNECGLTREYSWYEEVDTETCRTDTVDWIRMSMNGVTIVETRYTMPMSEHMTGYWSEEVDLSEYGLCGGILHREYCYCRNDVYTWLDEDKCQFESTGGSETDDGYTDIWTCTVCGVVKTIVHEYSFDETTCTHNNIHTVTYELDGSVVYSYVDNDDYTEHSYEVTSYVMEGETCEDGVEVTQTCSVCGKVSEYFTQGHAYVKRTETDLTSYGFCVDGFYQSECACGEFESSGLYGDDYCSFKHVSTDEETGTEVYSCSTCGLTRTKNVSNGAKDENCQYQQMNTYTYTDADGNTVAVGTSQYNIVEHNYTQTAALLEGSETCEDGVRITYACADCDYSHFYTSNYHEVLEIESYDLGELGLCGGKLVHSSCACGEEEHGGMQDSVCSWEHYDYYEEDGVDHSIQYCAACGAYMEWQHTYSDAGLCLTRRDTKVIVTLNEVVVAQMAYDTTYESHRYVYDLELNGEICEDGYEAYRRCLDCGNREYWSSGSDHATWIVNREMISEGQICADVEKIYYSCACGQEQLSEARWSGPGCTWEVGYWDETSSCWVDVCSVCGASCYQRGESEPVEGSCERNQTTYVTYKDENGEELFSYTVEWSYYRHEEVYTFEMQGTTCEEGYYCSWICAKCGESSTGSGYYTDCTTWLVGYEVIYDAGDICGPIVKKTYSSPCGAEMRVETGYDCSFDWLYYDSETETDAYRCSACGLIRKERHAPVSSEDSCDVTVTVYYTLSKDDVELTSGQYEYTTVSHSYVYSGQMQGESCDDGYYLTRTCSKCGETRTETVLRYGHENFRTDYYDLTDYGLCGGEVWRESCLCGQEYSDWFWNMDGCSWIHEGTDSETGLTRYKCSDCNTVRYSASTGEVNRETCRFEGTYILQLFRDDVQLLSINGPLSWSSHDTYAASFIMAGETCEDGYTVLMQCRYCDHSYNEGNSGHVGYKVETIDLTSAEYGLCGGEIRRYSCPCGEYTRLGWDFSSCEWTSVSGGNDGLVHHYCAQCNTYKAYTDSDAFNRETCTYVRTMIVRLTRDDVTLLDLSAGYQQAEHTYEAVYEGSCTDESFKIIQTCVYCGNVTEGWASGHDAYAVKYIDLNSIEGLCGGYIQHVSCPCGENSWINWNFECVSWNVGSWEEEGADGYTHQFEKKQCTTCGFTRNLDRYYVTDTALCQETRYDSYSFYNGEELIYTCNVQDTYDAHSYGDPVLTLMEGAETCEDGVRTTWTCETCGYVTVDINYYHANAPVERIDLRQYGATCATELVRYVCACGEYQNAQLEGAEMCDMDWMYEDETYYSQYNTNGWVSFWDQYRVLTCAVSDPLCGFKIRHVRTWEPTEESACVREEQVVWMLGYDAETGTCQAVVTVNTGNREQYHNYTTETATETQEDGSTVTTETSTCADCGSTYVYTQQRDVEDNLIMRTRHAVNTLTNEFDKEWLQEEELGFFHNGYNLETRSYSKQIHADGTEYWSQSVYSYNFDNACERIVNHTDSYGSNDAWTDQHFYGWNGSTEWTREATCSQFGEGTTTWTCVLCGATKEEARTQEPICHSWYEREDGTYGCEYCNMISYTGASGSIVLEDLSDYKTGYNYVAGYWNRGDVEFTTYVCVYLCDVAEGENDEILLEGIETTMLTLENDGMTAVSFSWSGADAAADAAVEAAGYTGEYYVRLVFVPVNGEDTLDYAVTFVPEEY